MSKFSNFMSTIASRIQSTFVKIKPYKKILFKPKEHVIYLISLRNGQILAFLRKNCDSYIDCLNVYLYDSKDNYSSPQNIEFEDLDKYEFVNNNYDFNSFELENEDIVLSYGCVIEIRKKENNKCSLIKKIFYSGRVSDFKIKKLENNRFLVARVFELFVRVWGQNKINKKYECIFEKTVKYDFYFSLFINNNLFLILQDKTVLFYKHNFNNDNNKLLKQYKSKDVHNMILETKKYEDETILKYDFKCEIVCKLTNDNIGVPKCIYKNNIYFYEKNELCSINYNNFKVKKYYIDLDYDPYRDYSLCFISNDKLLVLFTKKIIVYKLNENGRFLKNKKCSGKDFKYRGFLTKIKNGDIIFYGDKIFFFSENEFLND